jgi:lipopolysaccharide heptosyltransferase I
MPDQGPRILIVRTSAIGDVLHGLPVLCALRNRWPQAHLSWVVETRAAELLRGHAALDELVVVPRGWLRSPQAVFALRRQLRRLSPEVALDLQGLTKSAVAARLSGASRRIGFSAPDARELSRWFYTEQVRSQATHVVDRCLELLRPLGIDRPAVRFDLPTNQAAVGAARRWQEQLRLGRRFATLNPGAGWPSKLWPAERYAAVAQHVGQVWGLRSLVVWAGQVERTWAETIVAGSGGHAVPAPPTSLTELAALCRLAALFVGSDTGPLHLAAAVGTPCVGLFGPMPAERNGPYGPNHIVLQRVCLQGSSRARRRANNDSMRAIEVADVCRACDAILARSRADAA